MSLKSSGVPESHKPQMSLNSSAPHQFAESLNIHILPYTKYTSCTTDLHKIYIMHHWFTQNIQTVNSKFLQSIKSFKIYNWVIEIDLKNTHKRIILLKNINPFDQNDNTERIKDRGKHRIFFTSILCVNLVNNDCGKEKSGKKKLKTQPVNTS